MTRFRLGAPVALCVLCVLWPAAAQAETWWEWLEQLSGPGPFKVRFLSFQHRVCPQVDDVSVPARNTAAQKLLSCFENDRDRFDWHIMVGISSGSTGERQVFQDTPGDIRSIRLFNFEPAIMFHIYRFLDIGAGIAFMRFHRDEDFSFWRIGLSPIRVSFMPFALMRDDPGRPAEAERKRKAWTRLVHIRFEDTFLPQGFKGSDFNNPTTTFRSRREFMARVAIVFDGGVLVGAYR